MSFDPDKYLESSKPFDPDTYLGVKKDGEFNPDNYLKAGPEYKSDMPIGDFLRESVDRKSVV